MENGHGPSRACSTHLEQAGLHLLVAEGELAAVIDASATRNGNQAEQLNRLRLAQSELHQAQVELHQTAKIIGAASLASKRLDYLVNPEAISANQLALDVDILGGAARDLRAIFQALGGKHDEDGDSHILIQAGKKYASRKRLTLILALIALPVYGVKLFNDYQHRPQVIKQAVLAETQNFCVAFSNCTPPSESVIEGCIPEEAPFERLIKTMAQDDDPLLHARTAIHSCLADYALKLGMTFKRSRTQLESE